MITVDLIAGARPNFMKISAIVNAIKESNNNEKTISYRLIHTGQHFDKNMSSTFFENLLIPKPDYNFSVSGGTQGFQVSNILLSYEELLLKTYKPNLCVVVGDVNSTVACAIAASKLGVKIAHVEAGIRSYDRSMPEEINRILTDSITDYFFTTTKLAGENLKNLGANPNNIFFVGNTMIDTLLRFKKRYTLNKQILKKITNNRYFVLTIHRPNNVDDIEKLKNKLNVINEVSNDLNIKIIYPTHPRISNHISDLKKSYKKILFCAPLSYFDFIALIKNSSGIITDSGGVTEEATVLNIPCITLRNSTERPETVDIGTNILVGDDLILLRKMINKMGVQNWKSSKIPEKWDGKAGYRIVEIINKIFSK